FTTGKVSREAFIEAIPEAAGGGLGEEFLNPIYKATVEAAEEAIINALFKAETMVGINGNTCYELPLDEVEEIFKRYGREL
ncbi:MAG: P1 family peptidase, partial [Candidatus Bathyarchaeia archaeon]